MDIHFGEHEGQTTQLLVLKEPSYVRWVLGNQGAAGPLAAAKAEMKKHIAVFDGKPFQTECLVCKGVSVRCSVYKSNIVPMWWCASCDPYQQGANQGKLSVIITYREALDHVAWQCHGRKGDYRQLIKSLATAKGLPGRVGATQAAAFLA